MLCVENRNMLDELTGRKILPKSHLRHGVYYLGRCRNATIARWNEAKNCFYHWREKFERIYMRTIRYPGEDDPGLDVFCVADELSNPQFEIPFDLDAKFAGNQADLYEHATEMWSGCLEWMRDHERTGEY
jgi:hypothetical protein